MDARIDVVTLAVADLERALVFYRDGLGLEHRQNGSSAKSIALGERGADVARSFFRGRWPATPALDQRVKLSR
jgi:catechol-2,3-dioxygenase